MFRTLYLIDMKLRWYCFILRLEMEYICHRKDSRKLWDAIYDKLENNHSEVCRVLSDANVKLKRKFIDNTIDWIVYFRKLYEQKHRGIDWCIEE